MEQNLGASSEDRLSPPIKGGHGLTTEERNRVDLSSRIKGWGSDIDPKMRPGVPMDKATDIGVDQLYPDIEPQALKIKVLKSTEHGKMPPVFGTSCPPRGLSGLIRTRAYHISEGRLSRWVLLLFADRIDVFEGVLEDFSRLKIPNIAKETGLRSELKHNPKGLAKRALITTAALGAMTWYIRRQRLSRRYF